ncbi:MAG: hypothetical protein QOH60_999 [Mycobacterium sp.]|nr:hypothetical protein [Mycobacterium sp.]
MTGLQRPALTVARIAFAGALVGSSALVTAAAANAGPCDPATLAMTPQPQLSCAPPDAPPPDAPAPPPGSPPPASAPLSDGQGKPYEGPTPPPGMAPYIPPVVNADGSPGSYGQRGFFRDVWNQFHNGVPSDMIYGPDPADYGLKPGDPIPAGPPPEPPSP